MTKVEQLKIESFDLIAASDALTQQQQKVKGMLEEKLKELNAALAEEQKTEEPKAEAKVEKVK